MFSLLKNFNSKLVQQIHSVNGKKRTKKNSRYKKDVRVSLPHILTLVYLKVTYNSSLSAILRSAVQQLLRSDKKVISEFKKNANSYDKAFPPANKARSRVSVIFEKKDMEKLAVFVKQTHFSYSKIIRVALTLYLSTKYKDMFDHYTQIASTLE